MPLSLPPDLRNRLLARFEGAEARAVRLVDEASSLKSAADRWPALFRETWDKSADHHRLFLHGRLLDYPPADDEETEMIQQWLAFVRRQNDESDDNPIKTLEFHELIGSFYPRFIDAGDTPDPVETMSNLISEVHQAIKDYGDVDTKGDLATLLLNCIEVLSSYYEQRNDLLQAVAHANMAVIKAEDFGRRGRAMKNRCRSAKLLFVGSRNIDEALNLVLPIWEVVQDRPPSLDRAVLAYTLAKGYAQTGDLTETNYFLEKIVADLRAIGLGLDEDDTAAVFNSWLNTLPSWEPRANYTLERFMAAATLHGQYATLREITVPAPEDRKFWQERRERCLDMIEKCRELQAYQELVDQHVIAGQPIPAFTAWNEQRLDHAASNFNQWLTAIYDRFEEGDQSDELHTALYTKLEDDTVKSDLVNEMLVWQLIGEFHTCRGEVEDSEKALNTAYELATTANRLEEQLHILKLMVGNYLGPDHIGQRLDTCLSAIDLIEAARADITTPYQRSAFIQDKYEFYALSLKISWKNNDTDLMLGLMELVKARGYKEALLRQGEEAEDLKEELGALHRQSMEADPETLASVTRRRQILYDTRLLRARSQREPFDYRAASFFKVTEGLGEGEAVLNYCELIGGVWFFQLITGDRLLAQEYQVDEEWLHEHIAAFGGGLPAGYRGRAMAGYVPKYRDRTFARPELKHKELAEWLLPDEFREALIGCRHLRICPHHELHAVPFHALPYEGGYLIEQFAVSYLPNLSCLPLAPSSGNEGGSVALIGTDCFADFNGQGLTSLPGALAEVNELAAYYNDIGVPVLNFNGEAARREHILSRDAVQELETCRVVHLAVHGEDPLAESPMDARLFLRDGFIDGFDVSLLRLSAEVVVLSACFAGARPQAVRGFDELAADDMYGLQSAFFSAGASSVLGALWPVEDQTGKELMVAFHQHLQGHSPAEALRLATLEYLRLAPPERRGVVYWGSFFLVEG
ncbi:CHAT domain-containing protein [Neolewinella aurantiaca]|uniref:CHAT domain-containing protein n=1 Tax=Neolewinella aurantiaca TaxID=2602767 RepID=A0A5C7FZE2_9BACT|nr:CHAT domain-containing protein [Neolewinella aurantiaca]TXF91096.1 CHAT domain-containing protein [Neolewinella aurantiaca]